jgi:formate dehydrogenase major subunit
VGCGFKAEMKGSEVVRMVPWKERQGQRWPLVRQGPLCLGLCHAQGPHHQADDPREDHRSVARSELGRSDRHAASEFKRIQAKHGRDSIGGITSSRCTNEETYLVQKLVRAAFGNNNVDTCARVCHSPTGYGLKPPRQSAGTQTFASVEKADVIMVIGANPTDGHPVFASRMKRRLRQGAQLIVVDPRRIDIVDTPHVKADIICSLRPGTNVALVNALAHVIVTEGLVKEASSPSAANRVRSSNGATS